MVNRQVEQGKKRKLKIKLITVINKSQILSISMMVKCSIGTVCRRRGKTVIIITAFLKSTSSHKHSFLKRIRVVPHTLCLTVWQWWQHSPVLAIIVQLQRVIIVFPFHLQSVEVVETPYGNVSVTLQVCTGSI